jgi:hypothetical protein
MLLVSEQVVSELVAELSDRWGMPIASTNFLGMLRLDPAT